MNPDDPAWNNTFQDILRLWINPEVDRRIKDGRLTNNFVLRKAQVLLNPNGRNPEVRLNEEVKAEALARLKPGIHKKYGEPIFENEIQDEIFGIKLTDKDDPNSAHVTMLQFKTKWIISFDFRFNKAEAKERYDAALEFYEAAKINYEKKYWRPFVDNLFSSAELLVTSRLLVLSLLKKIRHNSIQMEFNSFINIGNAKEEHKKVFNKLSGLRDAGRYLNRPFIITPKDGKEMLEVVEDLANFTKKAIT